MSPLTKLFVGIHVVLSLLLTAGLIVFVNRTENFANTAKAQVAQIAAERNKATAAEADAQAARSASEKAVQQVTAQITQLQSDLTKSRADVADRDSRLAQASAAQSLGSADNSKLAEALKASEDQKAKISDSLASSRTDIDNLIKKNSDLNLAVTDLTNRLDVSDRERKNFQEQLAQLQGEAENMRRQLADAKISPGLPGGLAAGAVPINGVVRDTRNINNIPYATISVGAQDNVQKGMRFYVIDRQRGVFLGQLTVDSVEPNEATGRLDGPRISEARPGVEVRTQL